MERKQVLVLPWRIGLALDNGGLRNSMEVGEMNQEEKQLEEICY